MGERRQHEATVEFAFPLDLAGIRAWLAAAVADLGSGGDAVERLVRTAWRSILERLSLATRDEVTELRARVDALEALLRPASEEAEAPRQERMSPRIRESLGRARAALAATGFSAADATTRTSRRG